MKSISILLMFVMLGVVAGAQEPSPVVKVAPLVNAKIVTEIAGSSESTVKNAPFSADAVSESVQTLADGNRIVRNSTSKLYRNSEGRFRREMTGGTGGMFGSLYTYGQGISLFDPVGGFRYMIDPNLKTTRQFIYKPGTGLKVLNGATTIQGSILSDKVQGEIKAAAAAAAANGNTSSAVVVSDKVKEELRAVVSAAPMIAARGVQLAGDALTGVGMAYAVAPHSKWETRTEELGTQNIEGVDAEGTRTITTIPAGAIGNERPIEITYEKWYSRELQLVVMSKHNDPRFGEQTYRLTNIVRSEPDPSLFSPPHGYKLVTEPSGTYTISTKAALATKAGTVKPATTYVKTKP